MAIKTISNTGGNFNSAVAWTDGAAPNAGDSVVATATSGPLTISAATVSIVSADFTNYTSTLTINNTFNVTTTVVFVSGMTIAGTGGTLSITPTAGASLTSGGKTLTCSLTTLGTSQTITLVDNWTVDGTVTLQGTTTQIINGNTLFCNSNLTVNGLSQSGTTAIVLSGTGTWSSAFTSRVLLNNLTINTTGTITISGTVNYRTGTLTYTAGTVTTSGSTLAIGASTTLNTDGISWNNISFTGTIIVTLLSNLTLTGLLSNTGPSTLNGFTLNIGGGLTYVSNLSQGTTLYNINGPGTLTCTGTIRNNLTINTSGTITFAAAVFNYSGATLTYTAGKVIATGSTLTILTATTLINCHKINFDTVIIQSGITITMNEFFSGSPNLPVKVQATSAALGNYNITFQNGFEKIAKFVKITNLTLTNTAASGGSLLILNNKGKSFRGSNNIGNIRYTNSSPNSIAKNAPSVVDPITYPTFGLVADPAFN